LVKRAGFLATEPPSVTQHFQKELEPMLGGIARSRFYEFQTSHLKNFHAILTDQFNSFTARTTEAEY
jgi:hypothetical protein